MTTREKIIVGLMCVTVIYGAYEVLFSGSSKSNKSPTIAQSNSDDLQTIVAGISQKLTVANNERENVNAVVKAVSELTKDPFIQTIQPLSAKPDVQVKQNKTVEKSTREISFSYSGFMQVGDIRLAIIDGIEYVEGDAIGATGYYIRSISDQRVVLGQVNGKEIIRLPLQEIVN